MLTNVNVGVWILEINYLYTLLAVVNHRSFAKAGQSMGLSRSGVSLQIKALENEFGVLLFDRSARPPRLTPDGQKVMRWAREMLSVWSTMSQDLRHESVEGVLCLGAVHTVVSGILAPALERIHARRPRLQIRLTTGLFHELEAGLRRGTLDAAIAPETDNAQLDPLWQPFCREPIIVIAKADVPGATDEELLATNQLIRFRRVAWGFGRMIDRELTRRGIETRSHMEVDSLEAIFSLVLHGLGVAIAPQRWIRRPIPEGIRAVPFGDPPLTRTIGILQSRDNPRSELVQELLQDLIAVTEANRVTAG